jgi:hypothetical protein
MQTLIRSIVLAALLTLFAQSGFACWCIKPEAAEAFTKAGAVFVGQVVEITEPASSSIDAPLFGRFFVLKFKIEKSWKGAEFKREINVLSAQGRYGCFAHPPISKGERYLIYADLANGWLSISSCSRTARITDPITPAAPLRSGNESPTPRKDYPSLAAKDVDVAADLRLLESLLFPTFRLKSKLGRDVDRLPFLNFTEPGVNPVKQ